MFRRMEAALLAGLLMALAAAPCVSFAGQCGQVRGQVLRLHVLAHSDSAADQQNKLAVRDALLAQSESLFAPAQNLQEAADAAAKSLPLLEQTAREALRARGCADPVRAELVREGFATRSYGAATLPAGNYLALRVVIGEGRGQNWWCVMYPPLCLPAAAPRDPDPALAGLQEAPAHRVGFAAVELWEQAKNLWRQLQKSA